MTPTLESKELTLSSTVQMTHFENKPYAIRKRRLSGRRSGSCPLEAEDDEVEDGVGTQAAGAMRRHAVNLADQGTIVLQSSLGKGGFEFVGLPSVS